MHGFMVGRVRFAMEQHETFLFVLGQKKWPCWLYQKEIDLGHASQAKTLSFASKLSTGVDFTLCRMVHRAIQLLIYLNLPIDNAPVVLSVYLIHCCLF